MRAAPLTDAQKTRAAELREQNGYSAGRIARLIGAGEGAVGWFLLIAGVEKPGGELTALKPVPEAPVVERRGDHLVRRFTRGEDERLLALEAQGVSYCAIGKALGRKPNAVRGRLAVLARRAARAEAQDAEPQGAGA